MDIYEYLEKDHRAVKELIEKLLSANDNKEKQRLFDKIRNELSLHADTEEETFYKALQENGGKQLQKKEEHAEHEHDEIRQYLAQCEGEELDSEEWLIAFGQLKHAVEHHVEEEEGEIFEKSRKVISGKEAEILAETMDSLKQQRKSELNAA